LGLPRLEALAHAAETLMGKFRDGMRVTGDAVTLILSTIDRLKEVLNGLEQTEAEPEGEDKDLIGELERMAIEGTVSSAAAPKEEPKPAKAVGTLIEQTLERPLRPGEVSLDELERAFRETATEIAPAHAAKAAAPAAKPVAAGAAEQPEPSAKDQKMSAKKSVVEVVEASDNDRVANQSIRVNVDTLEHLMTMVSELVLTRNQLLEISRRNEDTEFKVPLQRLSNVTAELQEGVM